MLPALGGSQAYPGLGWEAGTAEGGWGTSLLPYICSISVLFYHLTYLVYLTVRHEHMTPPRVRLSFLYSLYGCGQEGGNVLPDWQGTS